LRKFVFLIIAIHTLYFFTCWSSQYLNNFHNLISSTFSWEYGHSKHQFSNNTSNRPYINRAIILSISKNQLWSPVISRTYIGYIGLPNNQLFGTSKITKFDCMCFSINQNILRLNISVTNTHCMDVCNRS